MGGRQQAVATWRGRYPNSVDVLQHVLDLPGIGPMETRRVVKLYEPSEALLFPFSMQRQDVGPVKCAGASALDALVSQLKLYADHPALFL